MTEDPKQAVVDQANAPAEPSAAVDSARTEPDLEQLLASYDAELAKPSPAPSPPEPTQPSQPTADPILQQVYQRQLRQDIDVVVKTVAGDTGAPPDLVEGWLLKLATDNPELDRTFRDRFNNPRKWQVAESALQREWTKKWVRRPDADATADRAALVHAVRGASTPTPPSEPPPSLGGMTDAEFREYTRKNFGFV